MKRRKAILVFLQLVLLIVPFITPFVEVEAQISSSYSFSVLVERGDTLDLDGVPRMSFLLGENVLASAEVTNVGTTSQTMLIVVQLKDPELHSLAPTYMMVTLSPGQNLAWSMGFMLPFTGYTTGTWTVKVMVLDDWPAQGGVVVGDPVVLTFTTIEVVILGSDLLSKPAYYYEMAERYVSTEYQVPENRDIGGLVFFLDQLEFPEYLEDVFDCSESSSLLEWLLEGAGFHAFVVSNSGHAWVQVETSDGIVAIEAGELNAGWGLSDYSAKPTGIVMRTDGTFKEYTYMYRRFLEWKRIHPSPPYDYDPNITFEEWMEEWTIDVIQPYGIPSESEYYDPGLGYESPTSFIREGARYFPTYDIDWWNADPYVGIFPLLERSSS